MRRRRVSLAACVLMLPLATAASAQSAAPQASPSSSTTADDRNPIVWIVPNLWHDLTRLPSVETALTLGIGGGLALAVHPADDTVTEHATAGGPKTTFEIGSALGSGWTQVGLAVGAYGVGAISGQRAVTHLGADLIRAQTLNVVITQGLKYAVQRQRPGETNSSSYSFPSGHTSSAFATAAVVWRHYGWKAGVPASAVGAWVGAGRVQIKRHFLSDVVFGAAVGISSGRTVTIGHGQKQFALVPAVVPGGAAAMFTLVAR